MARSTSSTTPVAGRSARQVPATQVRVGDFVGPNRSDTRAFVLSAGADWRVARITAGPGGRVQLRDAQGKMIRSCDPDTQVWRGRDAAPADPTPAPAADAAPAPAGSDDDAARAAAQATVTRLERKLAANPGGGLASRDARDMERARQTLGLDSGGGTRARRQTAAATAGRTSDMRALAAQAQAVGGDAWHPAAGITGPNMARVAACLHNVDGAPLFGLSRRAAVEYVRTGTTPKKGLPWQLRKVGQCAGARTFYGRKLVSMLVALYDAPDHGQSVQRTPGIRPVDLTPPATDAPAPAQDPAPADAPAATVARRAASRTPRRTRRSS